MMACLMATGMMTACGGGADGNAPTADDAGQGTETNEPAENDAGQQTETSTGTQASDDFIQVVEQVGEKGDEIDSVVYIPASLSLEFFQMMADTVVQQLNDAGFDAECSSSPEMDSNAQLEIFENCVTQGYDCIILFPVNKDAMTSAVAEARKQGIKVICQVNQCGECDGWVGSDGVSMGIGLCEVAADWVESTFPDAGDGEVKCAVVTTNIDQNTLEISSELEKIEDYSSKISVETVVESNDTSVDDGMALAENLYMTNPDIDFIISEEGDLAVGINNYYAGADSPLDDLSKFGVFCNNGTNTQYELIKKSAEDKAVLRGISTVAPLSYGCMMMTNCVIRLSNGQEGEENFQADPVYKLNAENIDSFLAIQ